MSNLLLRVLTALILLPIVVYAIIIGGFYIFFLLSIVAIFAALESALLVESESLQLKYISFLFWLGIFLPLMVVRNTSQIAPIFSLTIFLAFLLILFSKKQTENPLEKIAALFFICTYVFLGIACVYWLQNSPLYIDRQQGVAFILIACIFTWINDSFAFFGGKLFGSHSLSSRVSKNKTIEGLAIGAFFALLIGFSLKPIGSIYFKNIFSFISYTDLAWIFIPGIILTPLGDLVESKIKRLYLVKDSSNILPGHGGILDRIDSLLIILPWTAIYALIIRPVW